MGIVICFDFDLTLTENHSGGYPNEVIDPEDPNSPPYTAWNSIKGRESVKAMLITLKKNGFKTYIVSRGIQQQINQYLSRESLTSYFNGVMGAYDGDHLEAENWANIKLDYIQKIAQRENVTLDKIIFFDDTQENIAVAKAAGVNALLVNPPTSTTTVSMVSTMLETISFVMKNMCGQCGSLAM